MQGGHAPGRATARRYAPRAVASAGGSGLAVVPPGLGPGVVEVVPIPGDLPVVHAGQGHRIEDVRGPFILVLQTRDRLGFREDGLPGEVDVNESSTGGDHLLSPARPMTA